MNAGVEFTSQCKRWQLRALFVGAIATTLSIMGAFLDDRQFFRSYLFAWLFWSGLSLGSLVIVMMQFLTGGQWGAAIRSLRSCGGQSFEPLVAALPLLRHCLP